MPETDQTVVLYELNTTASANVAGRVNSSTRIHVLEAVGDIEVKDAVELSTEPGVMGRIGAKFPRSGSFRVRVRDNDPRTPNYRTARAQHGLLRSLVGKLLYIDARASPPERITWTIENANAVDDNSAKNAYDVDVTAREIVGGNFGDFIDPDELVTTTGLVPLETDDPSLLGIGTLTCDSQQADKVDILERVNTPDPTDNGFTFVNATIASLIRRCNTDRNFLNGTSEGLFGHTFIGGNPGKDLRPDLKVFLEGFPLTREVFALASASRPDMNTRSHTCRQYKTEFGISFTFSFDRMGTDAPGDVPRGPVTVSVHHAADASDAIIQQSTGKAPLVIRGLHEDPSIGVAVVFLGKSNDGVDVGSTMLILVGEFQ